MQLDGRTILITGAGSGIGRAVAILCAGKGARLVLAGRRVENLTETRSLLPSADAAVTVTADVSKNSGRAAIVVACAAQGSLDVAINNAGMVACGPLESHEDEILARMLATNLTGPMALTRDLLPLLRRSGSPRIVNIGSVFGDIAHPHFAAYSASKFAIRGFSDALRRELAREGIGVTYVAPRTTRTSAADGFAHLIEPFAMTVDSPETVARQIVGAIESEAPSFYARGAERLFVLVQRLMPKLIDRALIGRFNRYLATQCECPVLGSEPPTSARATQRP